MATRTFDKKVFAIRDNASGGNSFWTQIGVGFVNADGAATVRPMVLGEQRVRIALELNGRRRYLNWITPRTIKLTGAETDEIVLSVDAERLRKSLDRMKNR